MVDTSFEIPSFGFPKDENNGEKSLGDYLKIIDEYDRKIDTLSKENCQLRFDNNRMKLAFELISSYISSLK